MADGRKKGTPAKAAAKKKQRKLTPRDEKFVDLVVEGVPKARAYREAGFNSTGHNARNHAYQKITKSHIRQEIERRQREARELAGIDREHTIGRLVQIAFGSLADITDEHGMPDFAKARRLGTDVLVKKQAVGLQSTSIEMHDPISAIRTLAQMCGWLKAPEQPQSNVDRAVQELVRRLKDLPDWDEERAMLYAISVYGPLKQLEGGQ